MSDAERTQQYRGYDLVPVGTTAVWNVLRDGVKMDCVRLLATAKNRVDQLVANPPPACVYCDLPLSPVNDVDSETGGYWSAHSRCSQPAADGRFQVVETTEPTVFASERLATHRRFTTAKRAEGEAQYLNDANTQWNGATFGVIDLAQEAPR